MCQRLQIKKTFDADPASEFVFPEIPKGLAIEIDFLDVPPRTVYARRFEHFVGTGKCNSFFVGKTGRIKVFADTVVCTQKQSSRF